jgi:hypothetical protein
VLDTQDSSLIVINNLNDEYFSDYLGEFKYIKTHLDTYGNIPDKASFLSKFPNFDVLSVTESDSYLIDELYQDRNKRFLAKTFNNVRKLLNEGKVDEAMSVYTNASNDMTRAVYEIDLESGNAVKLFDRITYEYKLIDNFGGEGEGLTLLSMEDGSYIHTLQLGALFIDSSLNHYSYNG